MSPLSVYCGRIGLENWGGGFWQGDPALPLYTPSGLGLEGPPHLPAHWGGSGGFPLWETIAEAHQSWIRGRGRCPELPPNPYHRHQRAPKPFQAPHPSPRFIALLAATLRAFKRNSGESWRNCHVYRCLYIELCRAPVQFQRLWLLSINNERGS